MTFPATCPLCGDLTTNPVSCGRCGKRLIPTDQEMEATRVLRAEKLERVASTAESLAAVALKLSNLRGDEPRQQPPTDRYVALRDIERDVEHLRHRLLDLFS